MNLGSSTLYAGIASAVIAVSGTAPIHAIADSISKVVQIESLAEIPKTHPEKTIIFVDIDDTAIDFP